MAVDVSVSAVDGMRLEVIDDGSRRAADGCGRRPNDGAAIPIRARVEVVAPGGLLAGTATVDAAECSCFPLAPPQSTAIPKTELLDRLGTHLTRHIGPGVEYADIRAVRPRRPVAHGQLAGERAPRQPARHPAVDRPGRRRGRADRHVAAAAGSGDSEATERTLRGAVQVVQSALRSGDRAGIVTLGGGRPRWLGADIGRRQFYRVLDTLLGAGDEFETTTGTLAPRAAVPPGAIVVAFSTMLDTEFALALDRPAQARTHRRRRRRSRGRSVRGRTDDPLFTRMWAMQRSFMYRDMGTVGVDVVSWSSESTLDPVDAAGARTPASGAGAAMT